MNEARGVCFGNERFRISVRACSGWIYLRERQNGRFNWRDGRFVFHSAKHQHRDRLEFKSKFKKRQAGGGKNSSTVAVPGETARLDRLTRRGVRQTSVLLLREARVGWSGDSCMGGRNTVMNVMSLRLSGRHRVGRTRDAWNSRMSWGVLLPRHHVRWRQLCAGSKWQGGAWRLREGRVTLDRRRERRRLRLLTGILPLDRLHGGRRRVRDSLLDPDRRLEHRLNRRRRGLPWHRGGRLREALLLAHRLDLLRCQLRLLWRRRRQSLISGLQQRKGRWVGLPGNSRRLLLRSRLTSHRHLYQVWRLLGSGKSGWEVMIRLRVALWHDRVRILEKI